MTQGRLLCITPKELNALRATAETCRALGGGLAEEADEALIAYDTVQRRAQKNIHAKHLQITCDELIALIETADSCEAIGGDLTSESKVAIRAYRAVLKRNNMVLETDGGPSPNQVRIPNIIQ